MIDYTNTLNWGGFYDEQENKIFNADGFIFSHHAFCM